MFDKNLSQKHYSTVKDIKDINVKKDSLLPVSTVPLVKLEELL